MSATEPSPHLLRSDVPLAEGWEGTLVHRGRPLSMDDLRARTGLLAISVRNPRFSNALVRAFARLCRDGLAGGTVTVVDRPYLRNVAAAGRGAAWEEQERRTLERMAREARARAERIVAAHAGPGVRVVAWDDLARATPAWLHDGIRAAWARRGRFHADVLAHVRSVVPALPAEDPAEPWAEFLLEELPVLLAVYYGGGRAVVDVYPGPQPPLFWRIEAGGYADEMPEIARRLDPGEGLAYLEARPVPVARRPGSVKDV